MIQGLARLVKQAAESQKDLILDLTKQVTVHNDLLERAMSKQLRMEAKIDRIEERLMDKELFNYKRVLA